MTSMLVRAIGVRPSGATDLLVVADPDNLVSPADPSKVASACFLGFVDRCWLRRFLE